MGPGKRYPIEQMHGHNHKYDDHGSTHNTESEQDTNAPKKDIAASEDNAFASPNRDLWQRPDLILNHLGTLENKTLADIGAGPDGYFSFIIAKYTKVKKVLALDIDKKVLDYIEETKLAYRYSQERIETRLVEPSDPLLKENEADVVLISSTLTYIEDKVGYLQNLRENMPSAGRLVIVDYKMKEIPEKFPPQSERIPLFEMEEIIDNSGFKRIVTDDTSLNFQYIIVALKP